MSYGQKSMEKDAASNLFANDGSFMERFKQLQQQNQEKDSASGATPGGLVASSAPPKPGVISKRPLNEVKKPGALSAGSGKLAFSLKQKSKIAVAPVRFVGDDDEEEGVAGVGASEESAKRQRLGLLEADGSAPKKGVVVPSPPSDPEVRKVADKLASFVAKNGRQFEDVTRQRNPGDTPFKFLFDMGCSDYKYYEYRLFEEEKVIAETKDSQASRTAAINEPTSRLSNSSQRSQLQQRSSFQTPASALYGSNQDSASAGRTPLSGESSGPPASDPIAMMEYYMKKAAQEERKRPPKQSKDEMPPPASLQAPVKKGHHMGDYIPEEELNKFMSTCNDVAAQKAAKEAAERAKIQADNIGHKLLSKMGWKEESIINSGVP